MTETRLVGSRYERGAMIGRGGMGNVYRGLDTHTGTIVALKLLHRDIVADNPYLVDRFKREGEALRQLNHPNIVKILDAVEEGDRHYLIMEYVGGGSLRTLLDKHGTLPVEQVLNIALDLADALARAHRLNIIHRDIKPDNVLLTEDGQPRLTDFGVAHLGDRTRLTQTGSVIGTYAYLSPEACHGLPLDERADIWSFGVMLYEALAGQPPFKADSTAAILTAILNRPAPDLQRLRPEVSPPLLSLISRMLEKDRDRRISSIRLVGAELEAMIRSLDTPLRQMVIGTNDPGALGPSRFSTPVDQQATSAGPEPDIPAMEGSPPSYYGTPPGYPAHRTPGRSTPPYSPPGYPPYTPPDARWSTPPEGAAVGAGEVAAASSPPWRWITLITAIVAAMVTIISLAAIIFIGRDNGSSGAEETRPASAATEFAPVLVEPVQPGEYMVLVSKLEQLSGIEQIAGVRPRDVSRFIADDLQRTLQVAVPFSPIRVRSTSQVITTEEQARAVAEANGAAVIVWGNYTSSLIEVEVQVGALAGFTHNAFPRETLETTANVRVHLENEREQSIAPHVLGVLGLLQMADGDGYEAMRTRAVLDAVGGINTAELVENDIASYSHRAFQAMLDDPAQAIEHLDAALELTPGNALLYVERGNANQRLTKLDDARRDLETAQQIGPANWTMPALMIATFTDNLNQVLGLFEQIIAQRPDDWFPLFFRGATYYQTGAYDIARRDIEAAIALQPTANFPYVYGALVALHQGRLNDASLMIRTILEQYPDPAHMNRLIGAMFGADTLTSFGYTLSGFGNMVLGRYDNVLAATAGGLEQNHRDPDLHLMQGFAQCALGEYQNAELSYTRAIDLDPDFTILYLLRAEVRRKQRNFDGAATDLKTVNDSSNGAELHLLTEAIRQGTAGCSNFFRLDNPALQPAATAESNE